MQSKLNDSPTIEVINLRNCGDFGTRDGDFRIDRGTKFGNPFKITKTCSREECIAKYEKYFVETLLKDIGELKGARRLGCWCKKPNKVVACHGDVIKKYLENV